MSKSENTKLSNITANVIKSMIKDPRKIYTEPLSIVKDVKNYGFGGIVDYAKKNPKKTAALIAAGVVGGSALVIGTAVAAPLIVTGAIFAPAGAIAAAGVASVVVAGSVAFTVANKKLTEDIKVLSNQKNKNLDQSALGFDDGQFSEQSTKNKQTTLNNQIDLNKSGNNQNIENNSSLKKSSRNITEKISKSIIVPPRSRSQSVNGPSNTPSNLSKNQNRERSSSV